MGCWRNASRNDELSVPLLPDSRGSSGAHRSFGTSSNAHLLADIIHADPALTMYVLSIACVGGQTAGIADLPRCSMRSHGWDSTMWPTSPSLWRCRASCSHVKGQQHKARRLWRHSLASALWSRQLAHMVARETGCATCAGCCTTSARWSPWARCMNSRNARASNLTGDEYDRSDRDLSSPYRRAAWSPPGRCRRRCRRWSLAGRATLPPARPVCECNVVHVAHSLADFTLSEPRMLARDLLVTDQPRTATLGWRRQTAKRCSIPLRASAPNWIATWRLEPGRRAPRPVARAARLSMRGFLDYLALHEKYDAVNHPPAVELPSDNRPLVAPIYQSVKFSFDDTDETLRYSARRARGVFLFADVESHAAPAAAAAGELQGRDDCLLTGSGVATIAASLWRCARRAITCCCSSSRTDPRATSCSTCWPSSA